MTWSVAPAWRELDGRGCGRGACGLRRLVGGAGAPAGAGGSAAGDVKAAGAAGGAGAAGQRRTQIGRLLVLPMRQMSRRARTFMAMVTPNSSRPSSIRTEVCIGPVVPGSSRAMILGIVLPLPRTVSWTGGSPARMMRPSMYLLLPMSMVTAIVSPRARPSAKKQPPMMPGRAYGSTTFQMVCQRVAPRASEPSRWARGTAWQTS
jgi:hypothetical protein